VIVLYDKGYQGLTVQQQQAFTALLQAGIGVAAIHHTLSSHQDWAEYGNIIGGHYHVAGKSINGKAVPKSEVSVGLSDIRVTVVDAAHPITRGLQGFTIQDERFRRVEHASDIQVLATTAHPENDREVAWVKTYGKSRVFYLQFGHDEQAQNHPVYRELVGRGVRWVAGRSAQVEPPSQSELGQQATNSPPVSGLARSPKSGELSNPFFVFDIGLQGIQDPARVLKQLGYAGIGVSGVRGPEVNDLLKNCEQAGVKVFSTYFDCYLDQTRTYDPQLTEALKKLQGTDVILWLGVKGGNRGQDDAKAVAVVREIADLAAAANLRVALYPRTRSFVATTADALRLLKQVDRKNLGVTINLCHELMADQGPNLDATIREAVPFLYVVSINGADRKQPGYGWDRLIQPLGRGDFDVCDLLRKLTAAGYRGPIGLQCVGVKGDPFANLKQSIAAWREYSARLASEGAGTASRN
jgi:sugar phosphate isomerase/epimerase/type 1 glutamine amidotransferase